MLEIFNHSKILMQKYRLEETTNILALYFLDSKMIGKTVWHHIYTDRSKPLITR